MSKQLINYASDVSPCKGNKQDEAEQKDRTFNPPFPFMFELSLIDKSSANLIKIELKCDLDSADSKTTEHRYPAAEQFTIEDLVNCNNNIFKEIFPGKKLTMALVKFQYFSMFLKGEAKTN